MAEWEDSRRRRRRPEEGDSEPARPEAARETEVLPELHAEQHWAPWETPSPSPGRTMARMPTEPDQIDPNGPTPRNPAPDPAARPPRGNRQVRPRRRGEEQRPDRDQP